MPLDTFPTGIAYGSTVGPEFRTQVFTAASGFEQRNSVWANPRIKADASTGITDEADLAALIAFFRKVRGRANVFRFKDWSDYKITNQNIGTGDGALTTFQLIKTYTVNAVTIDRTITHPVQGTLTGVTVGGVAAVENTDFIVNYDTGVFTFTTAPTLNAAIVVGTVEFDIPARFDTDHLDITLEAFQLGTAQRIPIIEVRQ